MSLKTICLRDSGFLSALCFTLTLTIFAPVHAQIAPTESSLSYRPDLARPLSTGISDVKLVEVRSTEAASVKALPVLLVLAPGESRFERVTDLITSRIGESHGVVRQRVNQRTSYEKFQEALRQHQPDLLLIMDNPAVELYQQYQQLTPGPFPPAMVTMALLADNALQSLENAEAVTYEVPAVTSLRLYSDIIQKPLKKVGVLYSEQFDFFFQDQANQCRKIGIELVGAAIPAEKVTRRNLLKGLRELTKKQKVDGLWIISDNRLLTNRTLESAWIPMLRGFRKPVVVGVDTLLSRSFGNFAAYPDAGALALQISHRIEKMSDSRWKPGQVFGPDKLEVVVLEKYASHFFGLDTDKLNDLGIQSR